MYGVTVTTTEIIQHKPTYHSSGRRFSGSSFSGSFLIFLVLVLLVIDGFDDSGFAGFSLLVLLVLALLVLGGGFSGSSFLALLVLLLKGIGIFEDNDTIFRFLSFLSLFLYSINQPPTMQIIQRKKMQTTATFLFVLQPREFLRLHHQGEYILTAITITKNITQQKKSSGKSKKRAVTWMLRREESGCFLLAYGISKDLVHLVYSKNALLGGLVSLLKSITPPSFVGALSKFRYRRVWARGKANRRKEKRRTRRKEERS